MLIGAFLAGTSVLYVAYKIIDHDSENWWLTTIVSDNKNK